MSVKTYAEILLLKHSINELPNGVKCLIDNIKNRDEYKCKQLDLSQFNECSMENTCGICKYEKQCVRLWDILIDKTSIEINEELLIGYYHRFRKVRGKTIKVK